LFECSGSDHGDVQVQWFDWPAEVQCAPDPYPFTTDVDVWLHVRACAANGSVLHLKALAILGLRNPGELQRIERVPAAQAGP